MPWLALGIISNDYACGLPHSGQNLLLRGMDFPHSWQNLVSAEGAPATGAAAVLTAGNPPSAEPVVDFFTASIMACPMATPAPRPAPTPTPPPPSLPAAMGMDCAT